MSEKLAKNINESHTMTKTEREHFDEIMAKERPIAAQKIANGTADVDLKAEWLTLLTGWQLCIDSRPRSEDSRAERCEYPNCGCTSRATCHLKAERAATQPAEPFAYFERIDSKYVQCSKGDAYAVPAFAGPVAATQPAGTVAATVIKKGADRHWMSEALGSLPDGMYSLYLAAPISEASAVAANWSQLEKDIEREMSVAELRVALDLATVAAISLKDAKAEQVGDPIAWRVEAGGRLEPIMFARTKAEQADSSSAAPSDDTGSIAGDTVDFEGIVRAALGMLPAAPSPTVESPSAIQTWQERMDKSGRRECESLAIELMEAEITDLRAALATHRQTEGGGVGAAIEKLSAPMEKVDAYYPRSAVAYCAGYNDARQAAAAIAASPAPTGESK